MNKSHADLTKRPTFDGPQLWIHYDAQNRKTRPYRRQVFSHIQKHYRPWKRSEHDLSVRNATTPPEDSDQGTPASPRTILAKGNSDPFGVYAVNIGAQENELVSFYRDAFLPMQYQVKSQFPQLAAMLKRDWEDCVGGLVDEGIAHSLLARWGQLVGRCTPSVRASALQHQYRGSQLLRSRLVQGQDFQTEDDYLHISHLYSAETAGRNLYGARAHGTMLRKMFEQAWERGTLDYKLLTWQIHNDAQTAAIFLCRPVFDVEEWLPMVYAPIHQWAAIHNLELDSPTHPMDPSIESSILISRFKDARAYWQAHDNRERTANTNPDIFSPESITWRMYQAIINIGRLVNVHLSIQHDLSRASLPKKQTRKLLIQQYLVLAAIYIYKALILNPIIFNTPVFDARPAILPLLRTTLTASEKLNNSSAHRKKYQNARFWALYVGALAEQHGRLPDDCNYDHDQCEQATNGESSKYWFKNQLARQAVAMQVLSWDEAKPILAGFLYSERISPSGALWYEKMIFER